MGFLFLAIVVAGVFGQLAVDQALADPLSPDFWVLVGDAIRGGQWMAVAALAAAGLIYVIRRFGSKKWPVLLEHKASRILAIIFGTIVAMLPPLLAGRQFSILWFIGTAVSTIFGISGAWNVAIKPVAPLPAKPITNDVDAAKKLGGA